MCPTSLSGFAWYFSQDGTRLPPPHLLNQLSTFLEKPTSAESQAPKPQTDQTLESLLEDLRVQGCSDSARLRQLLPELEIQGDHEVPSPHRPAPAAFWAVGSTTITFSASGFLLRKLQPNSLPEVTATVKKEKDSVPREHECGALLRGEGPGDSQATRLRAELCPPSHWTDLYRGDAVGNLPKTSR